MRKRYATRGVIHSWANPDGTQKIELTGPLTKKRMETVDEEFTREAIRFMEESKKEDKPFFLWWNSTRMHIWTRLKAESQGKTGLGIYPDGMVEHDAMVGQLLDKLKELGLEDNTIVMYSTDNGAEKFTWPDGGQSPFRGEKNTNWEGGYRVPCAIRWPGVIKPGTVLNDIFAHEDMLPTLLAAAGDPDVKEKLLKGMKVGNKTFKVHLDGYNITDALAGKSPSPRHEFFYFNDDGSLVGLRYDQWKVVFAEQREHGFDVWQEPFVPLRLPKLFNLRSDPFETADHEGMDYERWRVEHLFVHGACAAIRREIPCHLQGVSAEPEARQLQHRWCAGGAAERGGKQVGFRCGKSRQALASMRPRGAEQAGRRLTTTTMRRPALRGPARDRWGPFPTRRMQGGSPSRRWRSSKNGAGIAKCRRRRPQLRSYWWDRIHFTRASASSGETLG